MTVFDVAVIAIALGITGGMYGYILHERRKLRDARSHSIHPAE